MFEDPDTKVSYSRIRCKRWKTFSLSDFHFSLAIKLKKNPENLLLVSAMNSILSALTAIFDDLRQQFERDLNAKISSATGIMYIYLMLQKP